MHISHLIPIITLVTLTGISANQKTVDFSAELLVSVCFILFIYYLYITIKSMVFNSLKDELAKTFIEFELVYRTKEKEMGILEGNYAKLKGLEDDLKELDEFLSNKLLFLLENREFLLENQMSKILMNRLNFIYNAELQYSDKIHNILVEYIVALYKNLTVNEKQQDIWVDNINYLKSLTK